jgi:hemoglobin
MEVKTMEVFYEMGGLKAVTTALNRFYAKVLADPRMRPIFNEMNADGLKKRVLPFMALVLSGLNETYAQGVRKTCERLASMGLKGRVFDAFLGHFEDSLKETGVPAAKIAKIMPVFQGARCEVCTA